MAEIPTVWRPSPAQESEFDQSTVVDIIDPSDNFLVDPSNNNIVDTGQIQTLIGATLWVDDAGA